MHSEDNSGDNSEQRSEHDSDDVSETPDERRTRLARELLQRTVMEADDDEQQQQGGEQRIEQLLRAQTGHRRADVASRLTDPATQWLPVLRSARLAGHRKPPVCIALPSRAPTLLASAAKDNVLRVFDIASTTRNWHSARLHADIRSVAWTDDTQQVLAAAVGKEVLLFDTRTSGADATTAQRMQGHSRAVTAIACGDGLLFSCGAEGTLREWDIRQRICMATHYGHQDVVTQMQLTAGKQLLTSSADKTTHVWRLEEGQQLVFKDAHTAAVDCCAAVNVTAQGVRHFVSGGQDGKLCLWDVSNKRPQRTLEAAHGGRWLCSAAALAGTDLFATGSSDGSLRMWRHDLGGRNMLPVAELACPGFVSAMSFATMASPGGPLSLSALLAVAVGKEHRLGRWWSAADGVALQDDAESANAVFLYPITLDDE